MMPRTIQTTRGALAAVALLAIPSGQALASGDCLSAASGLGPSSSLFYIPVYDSLRNITVAITSTGATWELANEQWTFTNAVLDAAAFPGEAVLPAAAYRSATGDTVVLTISDGLWKWNGLHWEQESPPPFAARSNTAVAYDPYRDVLTVFGGHMGATLGNTPTDEMWEYDFASKTWSEVLFSNGPSKRQRAGMVFDPQRSVLVLFGGRGPVEVGYLGDTWEYDPADGEWTLREFDGLPTPSARERPAMAWHSHLQAVMLSGGNFGGADHMVDLWLFDAERWTQRVPNPLSGVRGPMTYDTVNKVTRQWRSSPPHQLKIQTSAVPPTILQQPANQVAAPGQPVQFTVIAEPWLDSTPLAYQWRHNGKPIPGANLSAYTIFAVSEAHVGAYDCVITNEPFGDLYCGKADSIAATLTIDAGSTCAADLNGDGTVGVPDLLMLLSAWGPCP